MEQILKTYYCDTFFLVFYNSYIFFKKMNTFEIEEMGQRKIQPFFIKRKIFLNVVMCILVFLQLLYIIIQKTESSFFHDFANKMLNKTKLNSLKIE